MKVEDRLSRLESLALNQTLIIEHLTLLVRAGASRSAIEIALEHSAEAVLMLVFEQNVPVEALELATDWRDSLAGRRGIMQIS